jgi:YheC/D like ATP-grasp
LNAPFQRGKRKTTPLMSHIAIFTADGGNPFRGNHQNFIDIIQTGKKINLFVFVLTPQGLLSNPSQVQGYVLHTKNSIHQWKKTILPMPLVIYNRIPNRKLEQTPQVQTAIKKLQSLPKVTLFNPSFFNKWDLYNLLQTDETLTESIPKTTLLESISDMEEMLSTYPILYLKPIDGKAGINMIQITNLQPPYQLIHQTKQRKKKLSFSSIKEIWLYLQNHCKGITYLIQQGIPLANYQNQPFDVRMLIQKNNQGEWDFTGAGVRIAGNGSISTHVPMGGKIECMDVVLKSTFPSKTEIIRQHLKNMGLKFAKAIEQKQGGTWGEMSMDFGIDSNGKCWFFEANAKPMKFDEPEIRQRSLIRLLEYCRFLSQLSSKSAGVLHGDPSINH